METIQNEAMRKSLKKKNELESQYPWESSKQFNIRAIGVQEGKDRETGF